MLTNEYKIRKARYGFFYWWEVSDLDTGHMIASWFGWTRSAEKAEAICSKRINFFMSFNYDGGL